MSSPSQLISLTGLDGGNPLAFLAALGTFRTLAETEQHGSATLSWTNAGNKWTPLLHIESEPSREQLVAFLHEHLRRMADHPVLSFSTNLRIPAKRFREMAGQAVNSALEGGSGVAQSFLAAFGCDAIRTDNGEIEDTALRTMSGAGHQHFLKFMNDLAKETSEQDLAEALFGPWRYQDPGPSLRFDPIDDRRYALRWKNPSQDPSTTVRGANRLAVEGIPLFPTVPVNGRLETTGFTGHRSHNTFWTWPIWEAPISLDTCRSVLSLGALTAGNPDPQELRPRGIAAVLRSQRITVGKYRNFTPARTV